MMGSRNPESPFPRKLPDGRVVVDERCACGCLRSQHYDSLAYGHGSCRQERSRCGCPKYTFKEFVFACGRTKLILLLPGAAPQVLTVLREVVSYAQMKTLMGTARVLQPLRIGRPVTGPVDVVLDAWVDEEFLLKDEGCEPNRRLGPGLDVFGPILITGLRDEDTVALTDADVTNVLAAIESWTVLPPGTPKPKPTYEVVSGGSIEDILRAVRR